MACDHVVTERPDIRHAEVCSTYRTDWYLFRCHRALETASPFMRDVICVAIGKLEGGILQSDQGLGGADR